jgi:SAM-dependent methyltransferase
MHSNGERARWERLAKQPYYAVLNEPGNRELTISGDRGEFFASGEREIAGVVALIRQLVDPNFRPRRGLDYGCGVGRLLLPLARYCETVTGIDISSAMLEEARRNCVQRGIANAEFELADEYLSPNRAVDRNLDFIHSYIVFQHIPPAMGERIFRQLVARLRPQGVGAMQFTYARRASRLRRCINYLQRRVAPVNVLANAVRRRPLLEPAIPMFSYDLGSLITFLGEQGCGVVHAIPTTHGEHHGATLLFRLP